MTIKKPEPVAWLNPYGGLLHNLRTGLDRETHTVALVTESDMEAYAQARVDEALDEAASLCDRFASSNMYPAEFASAIRELKGNV